MSQLVTFENRPYKQAIKTNFSLAGVLVGLLIVDVFIPTPLWQKIILSLMLIVFVTLGTITLFRSRRFSNPIQVQLENGRPTHVLSPENKLSLDSINEIYLYKTKSGLGALYFYADNRFILFALTNSYGKLLLNTSELTLLEQVVYKTKILDNAMETTGTHCKNTLTTTKFNVNKAVIFGLTKKLMGANSPVFDNTYHQLPRNSSGPARINVEAYQDKLNRMAEIRPLVHDFIQWTLDNKPWKAYGFTVDVDALYIEPDWPRFMGLVLHQDEVTVVLEIGGMEKPKLLYGLSINNQLVEYNVIPDVTTVDQYAMEVNYALAKAAELTQDSNRTEL